MIEHAFTKKNIARCIAYKDMISDIQFRDVEHRQAAAGYAIKKIENNTIFQEELKIIEIAGKKTFQFKNIHQELVSRLVSKNIRENYNIKQQNRQVIIENAVSFLKEGCPFTVYRFDIKSFFEKIDRKKIVINLLGEGKCSRQTIVLLNAFFKSLDTHNIEGLPRGIGISSILAEYVLLEFDRNIQEHEDVFFFARFVDDILIISSNSVIEEDIIKLVSKSLPEPLKVHNSGSKLATIGIEKTYSKMVPPKIFEYLGYKFMVYGQLHPTDKILGNKKRRVGVEISVSKIIKIKNRLIDSFVNYLSGVGSADDFFLLKNRIRVLTGNYYISDPTSGIEIKTGIFFNYSEKNEFIKCTLHTLDAFLRGLMYSKKHSLSRRIASKLSERRRAELIGHTFVRGFHQRIFYSFSYSQLKKIKECWGR